ncbi:hypothetical protein DEU56DRAFT_260264 [Suillus clintonianus]|uniref:uncharacterized protein n=1 Tax=Suillus clintonianus TaxID=1904413 RepID=UPI001B85DB28|nr:uncharacterized protein DEU56DRAFT_260264 [Suillus clintonianus]KAG2142369.1 hypothetical protein DEU56DRAFT_260264 [Suillus clintonianus]
MPSVFEPDLLASEYSLVRVHQMSSFSMLSFLSSTSLQGVSPIQPTSLQGVSSIQLETLPTLSFSMSSFLSSTSLQAVSSIQLETLPTLSFPTSLSLSSTSFQTVSPFSSEPLPSITSIATINPVLFTTFNSATTTISLKTTSTAVLSPTSVSSTGSPQLPLTIATTIGGIMGAVTLLAFLIFIAVRCRRKQILSVTPFNYLSTAGPARVGSQAWLKSQSTPGAVRPSSRGPSTVQYSDKNIEEYSWNLPLSDISRVDQSSSDLHDDCDASASTIARLQRARELEKLYPIAHPSRVRTTDHYFHHGGENWIDQMVMEDYSRGPSEELPAYPRSAKSLKSREADHNSFPSSYP